jgi:DNA (cytosine-5)-methyltransferase 1
VGGVVVRYLSVCSGIEAATQAWHPRGWTPVAFSEIEPFPSAVLAHHCPAVPNWGDMTKFRDWPYAAIDLLCGGTPCQSFSVAGLRAGLADPRGNLMLTFGAIAGRYRPKWLVWENVPGVLSSNGGRDFGAFLGMLGELGYGVAYRVLDAQYVRTRRFPRAVPQRRRRVFVVGYLGDWRRAAAVLFDRESLSGHPPPRREAGQGAAPTLAARTRGGGGLGTDFDCDGGLIAAEVASTLNAAFGDKQGLEDQHINSGAPLFVAHALRGEGFDASEDGTGRGTPLVPVALHPTQDPISSEGVSHAIGANSNATAAVAFSFKDSGNDAVEGISPTLRSLGAYDANGGSQMAVATPWAVRRLTPRECERLQAFPDDFTRIPYRGKPADQCPDGPRYKALGNSFAVNVIDWIGERITHVETIMKELAA